MKGVFYLLVLLSSLFLIGQKGYGQSAKQLHLEDPSAPWVFWYWMNAAVSPEGIRADLEAMQAAGIAGAYLMPISGPEDPPLIHPPATQLSPYWWRMVALAMRKADSLGIKLAMDVCDGFATAGGPWITPELSMQKIVWSQVHLEGGKKYREKLPEPESVKDYYEDIAVYAFPSLDGTGISTFTQIPEVTTSNGDPAAFLIEKDNQKHFVSHDPCWIQYRFDKPFTCRSIKIRVRGPTVQAYRVLIEVSDDGENFRPITRLKPARSGWQDYAVPYATFSIPTVTARYFRFVYDPAGSEPGSEDLDGAKWRPTFKLIGLSLFSKPQIDQIEGKNGSVWRISERTDSKQIPNFLCVPKDQLINITDYLDSNGILNWDAPEGEWTVLRMGHTSTGQVNATGGGGKGLECDKFNPEAVALQFNNWFGKVFEKIDSTLASDVLKIFHVDSWECGSQNWSPVFRDAFMQYCGYDPLEYLPVMAGIPVQSARISEQFLYDIRYTIAQLINENFYGTLSELAHEKGCLFSAESIAPTMVSANLKHAGQVDLPMGEFWLRSPTHDKPNDIRDAVSGAHIYGKRFVQAEGFTELRIDWDEYPGMLKTLLDRNYALGINRIVYHLFVHNPWLDRKPGMTLNGVGLYFQRDQTWWKAGRAWVEYAKRCQKLLQKGHPVVDIAVFNGWEIPRRGLLPDRLIPVIPGLFGEEAVKREKARLANIGQPLQEVPKGVTSSANIYKPIDWIDPLRGYHYDSFNEDALLRLSQVEDDRIQLPGGASYRLLIIPGKRRQLPEGNMMRLPVAERLLALVNSGATILMVDQPEYVPGLKNSKRKSKILYSLGQKLFGGTFKRVETQSGSYYVKQVGKGRVVKGPYLPASFKGLGIEKDVIVSAADGDYAEKIAWTHRKTKDEDIYFISNQTEKTKTIQLSLRISGKVPEFYDAVTDERWTAGTWKIKNGRTILPVKLPRNGSVFIILKDSTSLSSRSKGKNWDSPAKVKTITGPWNVHFNSVYDDLNKSFQWDTLKDWTKSTDNDIRYYAGTAVYTTSFTWNQRSDNKEKVWLSLGKVANIAAVKVNGIDCGVAWTYPYRVDISKALKKGENHIEIDVSNTWANRLMRDHELPPEKRATDTNAEYRLEGVGLLSAGLLGPVQLMK